METQKYINGYKLEEQLSDFWNTEVWKVWKDRKYYVLKSAKLEKGI